MTLKETIKADLTTAMKARDEMTTSTLRMVLSAITNAEVAGDQAVTLDDNQTIAVLQSEAKKRAEAAQIYADAGRAEAAAKEKAELAVIERYLPAAMSDDELNTIIAEEVAKAPPTADARDVLLVPTGVLPWRDAGGADVFDLELDAQGDEHDADAELEVLPQPTHGPEQG